jgi:DNA topoisomerase VI subunit B
MSITYDRPHVSTLRAAEYFSVQTLQTLTGQARSSFLNVIIKELLDNALDAAEMAGRAPQVELDARIDGESVTVSITDNGVGIKSELVKQIFLDFSTHTSDKAIYRTPTRGAQGNALKTVMGIPYALGGEYPIVVETRGKRHILRAWLDSAKQIRIEYGPPASCDREVGTRIEVTVPQWGLNVSPLRWAQAFSLFNPHASVKISVSEEREDEITLC